MIKSTKDCLYANNGFSSIFMILLLTYLVPCLMMIQIHTYQLIALKKLDIESEIIEIKAIRKVQKAFKEGTDLEETLEIESQFVDITVLGNEATIDLEDVTIELIYDDVFMCIQEIKFIES